MGLEVLLLWGLLCRFVDGNLKYSTKKVTVLTLATELVRENTVFSNGLGVVTKMPIPSWYNNISLTAAWGMVRNDLLNNGISSFSGPLNADFSINFNSTKGDFNYNNTNEAVSSITATPVIDGHGNVYITAFDGLLYSFYPNLTLKWKYSLFPKNDPSRRLYPSLASAAIRKDNSIIACSWNGTCHAVDFNGKYIWHFEVYDNIIAAPIVLGNGLILIVSANSYISVISPFGVFFGSIAFSGGNSLPTLSSFVTNVAQDGAGTIYSLASIVLGPEKQSTGYFICFDRHMNEMGNYRFRVKGGVYNNPVIGKDGAVIFSYNNVLVILHLTNECEPNKIIEIAFKNITRFGASVAIGDDGTIYSPADSSLVSFNHSNGNIIWTYRIPSTQFITSSPTIDGNHTIYLHGNDGYLYAIHRNGTLKWKKFTNNKITNIPTVFQGFMFSSSATFSNDKLYVGTSDGSILAIGLSEKSEASKTSQYVSPQLLIVFVTCGTVVGLLVCLFCYAHLFRKNRRTFNEGIMTKELNYDSIYRHNSLNNSSKIIISPLQRSRNSGILNVPTSDFLPISAMWKSLNFSVNTSIFKSHIAPVMSNAVSMLSGKSSSVSLDSEIKVPDDLKVQWNDIYISENTEIDDIVIGNGITSIVLKAIWKPTSYDKISVAVKLITKNIGKTNSRKSRKNNRKNSKTTKTESATIDATFTQNCIKAYKEFTVAYNIEKKLPGNNHLVKMFGIALGSLPISLSQLFNLPSEDEAMGIVMRLENGGSLNQLLHSPFSLNLSSLHNLNSFSEKSEKSDIGVNKFLRFKTVEKLKLLCDIAQGIADLHNNGIIHADLKPQHILLSNAEDPVARLSGFSLLSPSSNSNSNQNNSTSSAAINSLSGSFSSNSRLSRNSKTDNKIDSVGIQIPVYTAPEMISNPFLEEDEKEILSKPSFKTDIYAFAIIAWEVLTEDKPFEGIKSDVTLFAKIHLNNRPELNSIPQDTPQSIIDIISCCWDKNKDVRKSASEVLSILRQEYFLMSGIKFDLYFSKSSGNDSFFNSVNEYFLQRGYTLNPNNVNNNSNDNLNDENNNMDNMEEQVRENIKKCKAVVVFIDSTYQKNDLCMMELKQARKLIPSKPIITVVLEERSYEWANDELIDLCDLLASGMSKVFDISSALRRFKNENELSTIHESSDSSESSLSTLEKSFNHLKKVLTESDCPPSML